MNKGAIYNDMDREYNEVKNYIADVTQYNDGLYSEEGSKLYLDLESVGEDLGLNIWDLTLDKLVDILYDNKLL